MQSLKIGPRGEVGSNFFFCEAKRVHLRKFVCKYCGVGYHIAVKFAKQPIWENIFKELLYIDMSTGDINFPENCLPVNRIKHRTHPKGGPKNSLKLYWRRKPWQLHRIQKLLWVFNYIILVNNRNHRLVRHHFASNFTLDFKFIEISTKNPVSYQLVFNINQRKTL